MADELVKKNVLIDNYSESNLNAKLKSPMFMRDGGKNIFWFHAGLDATKDPPKCSSPVKMSVIEDHLKLAATTSVEAMADDDVLLMLSGKSICMCK